MEQHTRLIPLKRASLALLIFLIITPLAKIEAAAIAPSQHANIEASLIRIEAKLNQLSNSSNNNVQTMANLASKLSDDIALMSKEIGLMADRIVETEYLIVQVVTNQTAAAERAIDTAVTADGSPMLDKTNLPSNSKTGDLLVLNQILEMHSQSNGVLLKTIVGNSNPSAMNPPNIKFSGMNDNNYILLISKDGTFDGENSTSEAINANNPLQKAWLNMLTRLNVNSGEDKVYYAVKTVIGGHLSAISNTLSVVLQ
jgi:hypothetical protein